MNSLFRLNKGESKVGTCVSTVFADNSRVVRACKVDFQFCVSHQPLSEIYCRTFAKLSTVLPHFNLFGNFEQGKNLMLIVNVEICLTENLLKQLLALTSLSVFNLHRQAIKNCRIQISFNDFFDQKSNLHLTYDRVLISCH